MCASLRRAAFCLVSVVLAGPVGAAEDAIALDLGGGVTLELVRVKAGRFLEGSPPGEAGRGDDETRREVTIGRDFYIGRLEVTRGQFARFVAETGHRTEAEKGTSGGFGWDGQKLVQRPEFNWRNPGFAQTGDHPVVIVTYDDALAFTAWLSRKARREVTLPTEAHWEYAARAGSVSRFHGGDSEDEARTIAWLKANAGSGTQPAGQKRPNAWGLHDMSGNAYEWCRDWYAPYAPGPAADPLETRSTLSDKPRRVLRGGSWLKDAKACRSAARYRNSPGSRNADNGFRVVASVEAAAVAGGGPAATAGAGVSPRRLPPAAPPPLKAPGFFGPLLALLCLGGPVLLLLLGIILFLRRKRVGYPDVTARLGEDGFWLDAPQVARGSTIRYRVVVDGVTRTGEMTAERGSQGVFVYTGGHPTSVEVLGVGVAAGLVGAGLARPTPAAPQPTKPRPSQTDEREEPPFRGYPSAY